MKSLFNKSEAKFQVDHIAKSLINKLNFTKVSMQAKLALSPRGESGMLFGGNLAAAPKGGI